MRFILLVLLLELSFMIDLFIQTVRPEIECGTVLTLRLSTDVTAFR